MERGLTISLLYGLRNNHESSHLNPILARIVEGNASSIHIHEGAGYEHIGVMKQVGKKFGKFLDVYLMQKLF